MSRERRNRLTAALVLQMCAAYFGLSDEEMTGRSGPRAHMTRMRQVAMYMATRYCTRGNEWGSLTIIGRAFDGRDHSTVWHARNRIRALRKTDYQTGHDIAQLEILLSMLRLTDDVPGLIAGVRLAVWLGAWLRSPAWRPYRRYWRTHQIFRREEERLAA